MDGHSKLKYFFVTVVVILVLVLAYFIYNGTLLSQKPYQVLIPKNYPAGTTISLYKNIPPDFPKEIILEVKPFEYSGTTATPDGKKQTTISYTSDKSIGDVVKMYIDTLTALSWQIKARSDSQSSAIIQVIKANQNILLIIDQQENDTTKVTFQYEY